MLRLKTEIWVKALLRRCELQGMFGAVLHRGAAEAGALYVVVNHLDGTYDMLAPPPGAAYDDAGERRFVSAFATPVPWADVSAKLARARQFDSDIWAVEIEDRNGFAGLTPEQTI